MNIIVNGSDMLQITLPRPFMSLSECFPIIPSYLHTCSFYFVDKTGDLLPLHPTDALVNTLTLAAYGFTQPV